MNVMMVGFSGAGKTSYMGAMYGQWNNESSDLFSVRAQSDAQHQNLKMLARKLNRGRYPTSTDMLDRYEFTLAYQGRAILDFSWIDYRGGVLAERGSSEMQSVIDAINESHALIVYLDMPRFVSDSAGTCLILKRLSRLLQRAVSDVQRRCNNRFPVSIVLTKADMVDFEAFGHSSAYGMLMDLISQLRGNEHLSIMLTTTAINVECTMGVQYPFIHSVVWGLAEFRDALLAAFWEMKERERRLREDGGLIDDVLSWFSDSKSKNDMADEELVKMEELAGFVDSLQEPLQGMVEYLDKESKDANKSVWLYY